MSTIPQGYKDSKVGIIPEDWEAIAFNRIFERVNRKNTINNTNVLTISAQQGLVNQEKYFNKSVSAKDLSGYILVEKGEFAYNKSYSSGYPLGAIKRLNNYDKGVLSSLYICFKIIKENPEFYEHYFEAGMLNKEIYKIAQEGARNHGLLNMSVVEFFRDLIVVNPPKKEQEKIAAILTTWDNAIEKQEELIKEKEQLKKGLMQKLLSGEVRFSQFTDKWENIRLKDIGEFKTSSVDKKINQNEMIVNLINYMDVYRNKHIDINFNCSKTSLKADNFNKVNLLKGDILFTPSSETPDDIGHSAVIVDDLPNTVYSYHLVRFRPTKALDISFSGYIFNNTQILNEFSKKATGSTRFTLSLKDFGETIVKIPSIKEQNKIAEVLIAADKEIELLKQELKELKLQKKGLMQNLLTGKVRVKV